jgi:hypothetical protein
VFEADLPLARPDPSAAPVLRSLSADPDEGVSGWAKQVLARTGPDALKEAADRP